MDPLLSHEAKGVGHMTMTRWRIGMFRLLSYKTHSKYYTYQCTYALFNGVL